jgi:hypothetical protein
LKIKDQQLKIKDQQLKIKDQQLKIKLTVMMNDWEKERRKKKTMKDEIDEIKG